MGNEYRQIIRVCGDIIAAQEAINEIYDEYKAIGYKMGHKSLHTFSYSLEDGTVIMVFWEDGIIYENVASMPAEREVGELKKDDLIKSKLTLTLEIEDLDDGFMYDIIRALFSCHVEAEEVIKIEKDGDEIYSKENGYADYIKRLSNYGNKHADPLFAYQSDKKN